ncbi:MAG TPA: saccharopine dehydrogenase NADP-binding domain-containing protein [Thermoanaerobaculia bacterium]
MTYIIYGANGYTGELIAREAVRRGDRPVLGGRNQEAIERLAQELECEARVFDLDQPDLSGVQLVLHCAGPFIRTSKPMVDACLAAGVHYLDITGEIGVFESILARNDEAVARGVTLLPGAGFDVVPTDCLAAMLAEMMPDATHLALAFYAKGTSLSRGTTKTMLESIGEGGAIRENGRIVRVPLAYDVRQVPFSIGTRTAMTIPWGDVATAYHSTGIPNIRVYVATHPKTVKRMRLVRPLLPIAGLKPIRRLLQKFANRRSGPDAQVRSNGRMYLWGEVRNASGATRAMTMTTPEGYAFTVVSALNAVERVLAGTRPGAFTPSKLLGADFVATVPRVVIDV